MIEDDDQITVPPNRRPSDEQPRWRQDFPIDWPQDEYISRREFIKFLLLTSAAFSAGQFWFLLQNLWRQRAEEPAEKEIARVEDIAIGASLLFNYPENSPARLLVRVDEETFVAYEQQCTHLTCPVIPDVASSTLHCPCHEGLFDLMTGRPLAGPPRGPLARVQLVVRNGRLFATGIASGEERT